MMEEFIARILATRNATHIAHWKTNSYAQHVALGEFYDSLLCKLDEIVEVYQGRFGIVGEIKPMAISSSNPVQIIKKDMEYIAVNKEMIAEGCMALGNLLDELLAIYARSKYKLENLH